MVLCFRQMNAAAVSSFLPIQVFSILGVSSTALQSNVLSVQPLIPASLQRTFMLELLSVVNMMMLAPPSLDPPRNFSASVRSSILDILRCAAIPAGALNSAPDLVWNFFGVQQ